MAEPLDPIGEAIRNVFTLQGLGTGISRDVRGMLSELFDEIAGAIAASDPSAPASGVWRRGRIDALLAKIEKASGATFARIQKHVREQVAKIGAQQTRYALQALRKVLGTNTIKLGLGEVSLSLAKAIIDNNPLVGELMAKAFEEQSARTMAAVRQKIQQGMADSQTIDEMVRAVRGRGTGTRGVYSGGVLDTTTRQAEAIVRTAVNDIANQAHLSTYRENADVVKAVRFMATLDGRTTFICASLDGQEFPLDEAPVPPLHWGCRSVLVPVIDWEGLGIEPPEEGQRASSDGPVDASTNYQAWLEDQDEETQNDILGPARAELFRSGEVTLRDLVRDDGSVIRVEDL